MTWLARGLLLVLLSAALWKLGALGWETFQHWMFTRPRLAQDQALRAAAPVMDPGLQRAVEEGAAGGSGVISVYVWDLTSGASAALAADRSLPAASLVKVPVLVEVLRQERLGRLDPNELLTIQPEHWTDGSGVLQAQVGRRYSVAQLTDLMIGQSDNIAARVLMDRVGVDNVNQTLAALGLTATHLQPLSNRGDSASHVTSAHDMASLFGLIASGGLVDPTTSEQALHMLEVQQANAWLADDLPWWVKLAHKWGDLPNARHDAGVVYTPRGRYVIAVLTENKPADEAAAAIARVSRAAFDRLGADQP